MTFTGRDAKYFTGQDGDSNLPGDDFWKCVFHGVFLALVWRHSASDSAFFTWLRDGDLVPDLARRQFLDWLDPSQIGGRLTGEVRTEPSSDWRMEPVAALLDEIQDVAGNQLLRLSAWLLAMMPDARHVKTAKPSVVDANPAAHNFYCPLLEDHLFVLATLWWIWRLAGGSGEDWMSRLEETSDGLQCAVPSPGRSSASGYTCNICLVRTGNTSSRNRPVRSLCEIPSARLLRVLVVPSLIRVGTPGRRITFAYQDEVGKQLDWHRGEFLLFVEDCADAAVKRLEDILAPRAVTLGQDQFRIRTDKEVLEQLRQHKPSLPGNLMLKIETAHEAFENSEAADAHRSEAVEKVLQRWMSDRLAGKPAASEPPPPKKSKKSQAETKPGGESSKDTAYLRRVRRLAIRNFRGFVCGDDPQSDADFVDSDYYNTDADIVLLAAPNGNGKTGLLEALLLLLTGHHFADTPENSGAAESLFSLLPPGGSDEDSKQRAERFRIVADAFMQRSDEAAEFEVRLEAATEPSSAIELTCHTGDEAFHWPVSMSRWLPDAPDDHELDARLCGFFQDRADVLYDEASRGATVRDVFEPMPPFMRALSRAVDELLDKNKQQIEEKRKDPYPAEEVERIAAQLEPWLKRFGQVYSELVKDWPKPVIGKGKDKVVLPVTKRMPEFENTFESLVSACHAVVEESGRSVSELPQELVKDALELMTKEFKKLAKRSQREAEQSKLRREIRELDEKIADVNEDFPQLDKDISRFAVVDKSVPPEEQRMLDHILRDFERFAATWSENARQVASTSGALRQIATEVEAVSSTLAGIRAGELEAWLLPRREAFCKRRKWERERKECEKREASLVTHVPAGDFDLREETESLKNQLNPVRRYADMVAWQEQTAERQKEIERYAGLGDALEQLQTTIEQATGPSKNLRDTFTKAANTVLGRFAMTRGLSSIDLQPEAVGDGESERFIYRPRGAGNDGRGLPEFSTGQRAQIGVALMIAQNEMAQNSTYPPGHAVVILDDVSTSYDLSNLSREALLWRQLAYHPDPSRRRQLFIASHHEDLTNHLLDLLAPPGHAGHPATMRMLRFDDWDRAKGPDIKQFQIREAPLFDGAGEKQEFTDTARRTLVGLLERNLR